MGYTIIHKVNKTLKEKKRSFARVSQDVISELFAPARRNNPTKNSRLAAKQMHFVQLDALGCNTLETGVCCVGCH